MKQNASAKAETHLKDLSNFWIGFVNTNGTWVWLDGTINNGFQNWASQSPNWTLPLAATVRQSDGKWDPMQLNASLPFVCASPTGGPTTPNVTTKSTTTEPPRTKPPGNSCSDDYDYVGSTGYCYVGLLDAVFNNWTAANIHCGTQDNGGYAASIHFDKENAVVTRYAGYSGSYAWIGLRGPTKDNMTWSDGTPVDYTNWIADDGSFACHSGDCCSMIDGKSGQWYFIDCKQDEDDSPVYAVVCKTTPLPPPKAGNKLTTVGLSFCFFLVSTSLFH
ncbi:hypothetical protein WR25_09046 [Diploscapter pachys]|uniref:C-type lectin domain-containing protein n=1 Tax=Diploscapter pachys TaxID=2018661 RepID=A0A2A2K661_9BILA|nr:hypothetical protein WR25_09046 [Diploscapter pachys]